MFIIILNNDLLHWRTHTHSAHSYIDDEVNMYLRNVGNTTHIYATQEFKSRIDINRDLFQRTQMKEQLGRTNNQN
jgi:hypothetical protein